MMQRESGGVSLEYTPSSETANAFSPETRTRAQPSGNAKYSLSKSGLAARLESAVPFSRHV